MGLFGESGDIIDYTLLKKRGLLKIPEKKEEEKNYKVVGDVLDFSALPKTGAKNADSVALNPLANFDSFSFESVNKANANIPEADAKESNALRIKVEDIDYKLERLIERLNKIEEKLSSA